MKLSTRDAARYFARPEPDRTGLLIYGDDAMRVALRRQEVIAALIGPNGDEEMRLTRIPGADLRKEPALLLDAIKAQGFFPGPRVAFVEDATEVAAPAILAALEDWAAGDAQLVVTAGKLKPSSKLRKAFEAHKNAYATGIYDDPPDRAEIEGDLRKAGVTEIGNDAMNALLGMARELGPGDLRQLIGKLGLYKHGDETAVTAADVAAVAPSSTEADLDDVLNIVAEGRMGDIGPVMRKLEAQGVQAVALCIGASRHFRALYTAASDPQGPAQGVSKMRPPVFGPRRDRMVRQAQQWQAAKLEIALGVLIDTDLQLRSAGQRAPAMALVERSLIRLAMLGQARR
ncbi:DNA polymerase III subunit delta [Aquicoccus sp. G2-2]|uniref:DNA polymerase III subunit delta n=1 Tax=Aquicoccus sp. G2-2 TaxID=3092120 RepID=UPI002ADFE970|nr:DNA polymerase III subunit delta [Aquicoccus sp. G2-2]MEA1114523.1 DNA polymerase III subunit delta [Aquicoccus sp. G2-2]